MSSFDPATLIAKKRFISGLLASKNAVPVGEGRTHCTICQGEFGTTSDATSKPERQIRLPCNHGHTFGSDCIVEWLQRRNTCPECRHEFFSAKVNEVDDDWLYAEASDEDSTPHEDEVEQETGSANQGRRHGNDSDGTKCTCGWRESQRSSFNDPSRMNDLEEQEEEEEEWEQDWQSPKEAMETGDENDDGTDAHQAVKVRPETAGLSNDEGNADGRAGIGIEAADGIDANNDEQEPDRAMGVVGLGIAVVNGMKGQDAADRDMETNLDESAVAGTDNDKQDSVKGMDVRHE